MTVEVSVRAASFSFGDKEVWRNIDLEVEKGDSICLLGPNGCGKTTLLNCIHGDLRLKSGEIKIGGREVTSMSVTEIALKMGYVFQEHSAPFPYTSLEVVRMGRSPHLGLFQMPSAQDTEQARDIMASMGISHLESQRYTNISGGERQLVLIARTLCQEPDMILFDEPTSHLDFRNQALVLQTIGRLAKRGLTIIMTSHFPNHAWVLDSKVAMMGREGLLALGPAAEVMTEANLSAAYGIAVRVYKGVSGDKTIDFCAPEFEI